MFWKSSISAVWIIVEAFENMSLRCFHCNTFPRILKLNVAALPNMMSAKIEFRKLWIMKCIVDKPYEALHCQLNILRSPNTIISHNKQQSKHLSIFIFSSVSSQWRKVSLFVQPGSINVDLSTNHQTTEMNTTKKMGGGSSKIEEGTTNYNNNVTAAPSQLLLFYSFSFCPHLNLLKQTSVMDDGLPQREWSS